MLIPLILIFYMATVAVADYPYVNWTYPTGPIQRDNASNLTVHIGDTLNAVWTSTWVADHDRGPWIEMHCGPGNLARSSPIFCPTTSPSCSMQPVSSSLTRATFSPCYPSPSERHLPLLNDGAQPQRLGPADELPVQYRVRQSWQRVRRVCVG